VTQFGAEPSSIIRGQSSVLSWAVSGNVTSVSIDQSIGAVQNTGSLRVSPDNSTTYTLTATGPGGTSTASTTVNVSALFGSPPSDATRPLYVAVVNASLVKIRPIEQQIGAGFSREQLNLYLILLDADPPSGMNNDDLSKWVVDHYNFARAARMLNVVPVGATRRFAPT